MSPAGISPPGGSRSPVRHLHEPGTVVRGGARHRRLDAPLGVMGLTAGWRAARRAGLRVHLHGGCRHSPAAARPPLKSNANYCACVNAVGLVII